MKASLKFPIRQHLDSFLNQKSTTDFSYPEVGQTQGTLPNTYNHDAHSIVLGKGEAVWEKAKTALLNWQQFPKNWTNIYPSKAPIQSGTTVSVLFKVFGLWWINSTRIVYTFDEENRFGFAYGTLPGHVEKGEEVFWIEKDEAGMVSYHIKAFSRPAHLLVWLVYPISRMYQARFFRESRKQMFQLINS